MLIQELYKLLKVQYKTKLSRRTIRLEIGQPVAGRNVEAV
jgi:hypothetical protein